MFRRNTEVSVRQSEGGALIHLTTGMAIGSKALAPGLITTSIAASPPVLTLGEAAFFFDVGVAAFFLTAGFLTLPPPL